MADNKISRNSYLSKNVGDFPEKMTIGELNFDKVEDLRYGTNPHQPAAFYKPAGIDSVIGGMEVLKTGKSGLSQTNLEDISYALNIVKFFDIPAAVCMKHVNPSGAAVAAPGDSQVDVYKKARDCDPRAAFGSVVAFNQPVTVDTAKEIMTSFVECVVAPEFEDGVLDIFNDTENYKLNKHVRVLKCGDVKKLPKYVGDDVKGYQTIKVLHDGSLVIADPLLTHVKGPEDMAVANGKNKAMGEVTS
ncbi:MAG TPA: hypothetical protein VJ946_08765, partial [Bacteroidales bacterium]|nr:hypothetical protein [Bacteroidales bacterium]